MITRVNKFLFFFLLVIAGVFQAGCTGDKEQVFIPTTSQIVHEYNFYKDSEKMRFSASYGPLTVGNLQLDCKGKKNVDDRTCYHVIVSAELKGIANGFSNLEDVWESSVDTATLYPRQFYRDLKENKYRKKEVTRFDRIKSNAVVQDTTTVGKYTEKNYPITSEVQDVISAFYLLRNTRFADYAIGDTIVMDLFLEGLSYNSKIKYLGKEKIKYNGNKTNCFLIAPLIPDNKVFIGEHPVRVWISDDARKVPLKGEVRTLMGPLTIELEDYQTSNKNQ